MSKVVISIGYKNLVVDAEVGVQLLELLASAELYEDKYHGGNKPSTHHIYANDGHTSSFGMSIDMKLLPNKFYQMAKLAGKPTSES
jgi:hypothetical protein